VTPSGGPNAYVGPRPFPPDRQLYGRDRELLALTNRLLSERLVLLYSPSGAGKTSLIRARGGSGSAWPRRAATRSRSSG
jgi:MoxR-like ATPase